jgi:flagellar protein FliO/FliZ
MQRICYTAMWLAVMLASTQLYAEPAAAPAVGVTLGHTLKLLGGMLAVLAMIGVCAWVLKQLPIVRNQRGGTLKVLESVSLGTRDRMLLVDVEGTRLLIGVGATGMACLHVLGARAAAAAPDFATHMQQSMQSHAAADNAESPVTSKVPA